LPLGKAEDQNTKAEANYREAEGDERCGDCAHFDGESGCSLVAGTIAPDDTCDYFEDAADAEKARPDTSNEGDVPMTAAEKQQLTELQKKVADLTKMAASDDGKDAKKSAEIQDAIKVLGTELADLAEKLDAQETERSDLEAVAAMSDAEKNYMHDMEEDEKKPFLRLSAEERKKKMKKSADNNPVVYKSESTGEEYRKSDDPRLVTLAKRADESEKIAKAEREARETAELAKRVDEELKDFAGDAADKVEVLRAVSKMDEKARTTLDAMLKSGGKAISAAFGTIGHRGGDAQKSAGDFNKRVTEVMARDKVSKLIAMEKAEREFPDEFQAFQATGAILSNSN
jgi:hypothetical protein